VTKLFPTSYIQGGIPSFDCFNSNPIDDEELQQFFQDAKIPPSLKNKSSLKPVPPPNMVQISTEGVKKNLILHMIGQAKESIDANFAIPKALEQNKMMWARVMYHNKKVQEAFCQFSVKIKEILDTEIRRKRNTVAKYLK
jgi:hypothetical protein